MHLAKHDLVDLKGKRKMDKACQRWLTALMCAVFIGIVWLILHCHPRAIAIESNYRNWTCFDCKITAQRIPGMPVF